MIKITFFAQNLNGGGAEKNLISYLENLSSDVFELSLILCKKEGKFIQSIPEHVNVKVLNVNKTSNALFALIKELRLNPPDILYSTLLRIHVVCYLASIFVPVKLILRSPNSPARYMTIKELSSLNNWLVSKAYQKAKLVISQTEQMAEQITSYHGVNKDKIRVIRNPVDEKKINSALSNAKSPFKSDRINYVAAGRMAKQKGFDILLEAFAEVLKRQPNSYLYILGDESGEEYNALVDQRDKLGIGEHVFFEGFQQNPYQYYKFADAYILSSRWEGLPNTVLECLFIGTPVVATRCISELEKMIDDGVNGYLSDVENAADLVDKILKVTSISHSPSTFEDVAAVINSSFIEIAK